MKWKRLLSACSLLFCCLCVALKFWPSDRWHGVAPFVYVPPALLIVWMTLQLIWFRTHRWMYLTLMLFILSFAIWHESKMACAYGRGPATVRILHWNVWSLRRGVDRILRTVAQEKPDIICLNESKTSRNAPNYPPYAELLRSLTGYDWNVYNRDYMAIISKYPITLKSVWKGNGYLALQTTIQIQKPLNLVLIDVTPNLAVSRRDAFLDLSRVLAIREPDVIAGDFNTPSHAASLDPLWKAYDDPRCGIDYTWPAFMPMMRIDYILTRKGVHTGRHSQGFTLLSDHAWQALEIIP